MNAKNLNKQVRVRIAPSPTGLFHLGTARTALFNWLFAKHKNGIFVLRIEDTDIERSDPKFEIDILDGMRWLGINWDEGPVAYDDKSTKTITKEYGPYRQSERMSIYEKYVNQLIEEKKAYFCYCTKEELELERQSSLKNNQSPKYSGKCKLSNYSPKEKVPLLVRFNVLEKKVEFHDMIRGKISFDMSLVGDIAIAKIIDDGKLKFSPLYNFAVTIDDATMDITHVIRGEDHISNTPKQILIQEALGFETPVYAHLPLILSADRSKLSKRYVETSLLMYREQGFLPEAMVNFIAFLGWHPKDDKEIMSPNELASEFEIERVQKAGAIFNEEKLSWINSKYIKNLSDSDLAKIIFPILVGRDVNIELSKLEKIVHILKDRMKTMLDFHDLAHFFFELPEYESELLIWKDIPKDKIKLNLESIVGQFKNVKQSEFANDYLEKALSDLIAEQGKGAILWPLRAALSGKRESPGPYEIAEILGFKETNKRLEIAIEKLV